MTIQGENYSIQHDGLQYILYRLYEAQKGKNKGQMVETVVGYYVNESQLLRGLIKHGMADEAIETIEQINALIDRAVEIVKAA